jgi:hypothetical protein
MGEPSDVKSFWIPAFAGMTFLEVALILKDVFGHLDFGFHLNLIHLRFITSCEL